MKGFVKLPDSEIIINLSNINYIRLEWNKTDVWEIVMFNHTAMGTNNIKIKKDHYDFLYKILLSDNHGIRTS